MKSAIQVVARGWQQQTGAFPQDLQQRGGERCRCRLKRLRWACRSVFCARPTASSPAVESDFCRTGPSDPSDWLLTPDFFPLHIVLQFPVIFVVIDFLFCFILNLKFLLILWESHTSMQCVWMFTFEVSFSLIAFETGSFYVAWNSSELWDCKRASRAIV